MYTRMTTFKPISLDEIREHLMHAGTGDKKIEKIMEVFSEAEFEISYNDKFVVLIDTVLGDVAISSCNRRNETKLIPKQQWTNPQTGEVYAICDKKKTYSDEFDISRGIAICMGRLLAPELEWQSNFEEDKDESDVLF